MFYDCFFFFFQRESGIRNFWLSRGLGKVYERQVVTLPFLREAVARSGETALIARIDRTADRLVYNPIFESTRTIRYAVSGGTCPLYTSEAAAE